jgi:hypothetical protein
LPRSVVMKSCVKISATMPRTLRVTMPIGIIDRVIAGSTRKRRLSQRQSPGPLGPAPMAGSRFSFTLKITTITMPSQ